MKHYQQYLPIVKCNAFWHSKAFPFRTTLWQEQMSHVLALCLFHTIPCDQDEQCEMCMKIIPALRHISAILYAPILKIESKYVGC